MGGAERAAIPLLQAIQKTFRSLPAAALGLFYLRQIRAPLDQVALVAVGGIDESNVGDFLRAGCVAAGLGASLIDPQAVARGDWAALTERARLVKARAAGVGQA